MREKESERERERREGAREGVRERQYENLNTIPPMSNRQIRKIAPTPLSAVWSYAMNNKHCVNSPHSGAR
jgi:hypothetical protein